MTVTNSDSQVGVKGQRSGILIYVVNIFSMYNGSVRNLFLVARYSEKLGTIYNDFIMAQLALAVILCLCF